MNSQNKLKAASERTLDIYTHIGCLSTLFAGLEHTLLQLLAKIINPGDQERTDRTLSQLSFRQTIDAFQQSVTKLVQADTETINEVKTLAERLARAASDRNDIIHSSWIAYTKGDYGQHRARKKGKKIFENQIHTKNPVNHIEEVAKSIDQLVFDLACFEDKHRRLFK